MEGGSEGRGERSIEERRKGEDEGRSEGRPKEGA